MKKIGILTIVDYVNYGNRLQNYAAQKVLQSLGFTVETIVNEPFHEKRQPGFSFYLKRLKNAVLLSPAVLMERITAKIRDRKYQGLLQAGKKAKEASFRKYSSKYMHETDFVITSDFIPDDLGGRYDYFVTGSDQIWNPAIRNGSSVDFLTFAPREKRIALSPSFGVSSIPDRYREVYALWLSEMAHLSVREQAGADIIKSLTGREAAVLIDPTLMLTREQWLEVADPAKKKPAGRYLLTYFIGAVSTHRMKILKQLTEKYKLELVQMANLDDFERYHANPGEFIDYIKNAELICTDSFHAIIFSMLMEKPFVVFDREGKSSKMSSRIDTLLGKFKFESRKFDVMKDVPDILSIDYKHIPAILQTERQKVLDYLYKALEIKLED